MRHTPALRHIREGAQIPDPDFDGGPAGAPLVDLPGEGGNDSDEALRGFHNSFGFDDAGTFFISDFDTRGSAPLVVGAHLVNLTLPGESNFHSTNRGLHFLKLWRIAPTSLLSSITGSLQNAFWVTISHLTQ
ncbi:hypothetical protein FPCIR_2575 [Fusarium pseudocircinatum]|uniref:Uncharacterized protein n=1 Tax=Fusarium pseudocircinatum TaxID=56676 RepID=A0A8H5UVU0_9HYPO|nr:hypothetical protein FPCIR_2575 [Fusarium pseudocircinatum]